ncbi:MAG: peptidoglycan DD-metalloendopeptidase family protein [Bacillota bacterium]
MFGSLEESLLKNRLRPRRGKSSQERRFTLFLVSSHGRSRSISFGIKFAKIAIGVLLAAAAAFTLFTVSYRLRSRELTELRYMRDVAESQKTQIRELEEQYSILNERLRQAELLEAQIREMLDREGVSKQSFSPAAGASSPSRTVRTASRDSSQAPHDISAADMGRLLYALKVNADKLDIETSEIETKAKDLHKQAMEVVARLRATPSIWPVSGKITSEFGWRRHPVTYSREFHDGVDIAATWWTPIRAAADGVVTFAGYKYGYGWVVIVEHGYGYETLYAHCISLEAKSGDKVARGDVIAYVGESGTATGPHLHYEVHLWGAVINPMGYLPDDSLEVSYSVR